VEEARRDAGVSAEDVDRIREVNAAVMAGDMGNVSERLHPEVVWEHNLGGGSPEEGIYRGRESVIALLERILEVWEYLRAEPDEIRELGAGTYRVSGRLRGKHATSSTEIVSPYVQHFEMRDGLPLKGTMTTSPDRARDTESVEGGRRGEAA
jgi:ketosteroid isomerase-like protein